MAAQHDSVLWWAATSPSGPWMPIWSKRDATPSDMYAELCAKFPAMQADGVGLTHAWLGRPGSLVALDSPLSAAEGSGFIRFDCTTSGSSESDAALLAHTPPPVLEPHKIPLACEVLKSLVLATQTALQAATGQGSGDPAPGASLQDLPRAELFKRVKALGSLIQARKSALQTLALADDSSLTALAAQMAASTSASVRAVAAQYTHSQGQWKHLLAALEGALAASAPDSAKPQLGIGSAIPSVPVKGETQLGQLAAKHAGAILVFLRHFG